MEERVTGLSISCASSFCLIPVSSIDLCMNRAIIIANSVNSKTKHNTIRVQSYHQPIIGIRKSWSWSSLERLLVPHQRLQLAKLLLEAGICRRQSLCNGWVPIGYIRLGGSIEVGSTSIKIVLP